MNEDDTKKLKKNFIQSALIQNKFNQNPDLKMSTIEKILNIISMLKKNQSSYHQICE